MSDYGAFISITKTDNSTFTDADEVVIKKALSLIDTEQYENIIGEPFSFNVERFSNDGHQAIIRLSEYYSGSDEDYEEAEENDLDQAEDVAEHLRQQVTGPYDFEADFDGW